MNKVAQVRHIDLIVMSSHGALGLNEFFVVSNTEKVVRTSDMPVLVVKTPNLNFRIKDIVFAYDFTDDTILAFKNIKAFAVHFSAKLKLIYVNIPCDSFISTSELEDRTSKFFFKAGNEEQEVTLCNDYNV